MTRKVKGTRARLLGSVYLGVMATTLATGAMAADTAISLGSETATAMASRMAGDVNLNTGAISATVDGALINNTTVSAPGSTSESGVFSVTSNLISAAGVGNNAVESIDLSQIENDVQDGAAAASLSLNSALVTSAVTNSTIAVDLDGFASGTVSNTGNTIAATTQANTGSTLLAGEIPNDYASSAPGSTAIEYPGATNVIATGSLVATSAQSNTVAGHRAEVDGNKITLDLTSSTSNTVTAGPSLDANTISATLRGNNNQTTIDLVGGENPAFTGSAVITSLQLNTGSDGDFNMALNTNSTISANVSADNLLAVNTLNGGLSVSGNAITSRVAGNSALENAGNQILIGDTLSIEGTHGKAGSSIQLVGGDVDASAAATLTILNSQGNIGSGDGQGFSARTHTATISARVDSLEDGTVNTSLNEIGARASGNASTSAILSEGTGTTFDASAAIANNQTNQGTVISAEVGLIPTASACDSRGVSLGSCL